MANDLETAIAAVDAEVDQAVAKAKASGVQITAAAADALKAKVSDLEARLASDPPTSSPTSQARSMRIAAVKRKVSALP